MNQADIFNKVKDIIIRELKKDEGLVDMEASLKNDLNFDSIEHLMLMVALEKVFAIQISDEESEKLITIAKIVGLIEKILKQKAGELRNGSSRNFRTG